jgi:hypothetical protein
MSQATPTPLEWHPFYQDRAWLLDWLEGRGTYSGDSIRVPVMPRLHVSFTELEPDVIAQPTIRALTLTKQRAFGPAPYVGQPFAYVWPCAVDELGRAIAGDAKIVYLDQP